jgi:hypothetical protein
MISLEVSDAAATDRSWSRNDIREGPFLWSPTGSNGREALAERRARSEAAMQSKRNAVPQ